jgi:hypothetical protein
MHKCQATKQATFQASRLSLAPPCLWIMDVLLDIARQVAKAVSICHLSNFSKLSLVSIISGFVQSDSWTIESSWISLGWKVEYTWDLMLFLFYHVEVRSRD